MKTIRFIRGSWVICCALSWLWLGEWATVVGADLDPVLRGKWPGFLRGPAFAVAVSANYAYVANEGAGLQVLDFSNPANPQRVGGNSALNEILGVALAGGRVIVSAWEEGLVILEMLPFFRSISHSDGNLHLSWEGFGARLQQAARLFQPDWQNVLGSESTNNLTLPIRDGSGFFRFTKP